MSVGIPQPQFLGQVSSCVAMRLSVFLLVTLAPPTFFTAPDHDDPFVIRSTYNFKQLPRLCTVISPRARTRGRLLNICWI